MNQAIKIIDEMIADANKSMYPEKGQLGMKEFNVFSCGKASLEIARDRISSLPSDTQWIDTLQRYDSFAYEHGVRNDTGEYIRYDDLKKLLED